MPALATRRAQHTTHCTRHYRAQRTLIHRGVLQVAMSGGLDHVAHNEALDRLVLRYQALAVRAVHGLDVAAAAAVLAAVTTLEGHGSEGDL